MKEDIFCISEPYRQIFDDYDIRIKAQELYCKTESIEELNAFCEKILLQKRAKKLLEEMPKIKRFSLYTIENFKPFDKITQTAKNKALQYIEQIEDYIKSGTNLIIEGGGSVGTGKTHLACAIWREVLKKGIPAKFINVINLITELKDTFDIVPYTKVEVLIIDDFGKERGTEWVFETIYGIINKRYEEMKPTIITTEGYMGEMTSHYKEKGRAILSRLCEDFILIRLNGEDIRKRKK